MKYVLFCAGEDSGDVLGEAFVSAVMAAGYVTRGTGGMRMQSAGLEPVADYENLPVSGFGDVLPHYFGLRRVFSTLCEMLQSPDCVGLVAIDYPGFNLRLCDLAKRVGKRVLYIAPPQVWAWKKSRARKLSGISLAVLFAFERECYESLGCHAELLEHPFLAGQPLARISESAGDEILVLPGSRKSQAVRNLKVFLRVVSGKQRPVKILASRESLVPAFENTIRKVCGGIPDTMAVEVSPRDSAARREMYAKASCALASPGTATLELALSGCPLVVSTVPDALTYVLGSLFVKAKHFAMPNVLLGRAAVEEFIFAPWSAAKRLGELSQALAHTDREQASSIARELEKIVAGGKSAAELLCKFLESDSH
jgi:lipid-A-disaccharide synthase